MTRIEKLRKKLPDGFGAALIKDIYNRLYLTGLESSAGVLVVTEKRAYLIVDFRYYEAAKVRARDVEVVLADDGYAQIPDILKSNGAGRLYVEDTLTLASFGKLEEALKKDIDVISDGALSCIVAGLRAVKEQQEIEAIKAAQGITDAAFGYILDFLKPGTTERDIAAELEYYMKKHGADDISFPTICVSGTKTSMPHGVPGDDAVKTGDFITMDFGAKKYGYCSDMTRTVAIGSVGSEQKKVYDAVLKAHIEAVNAAKAGIKGSELDKIARDIIYAEGFE